MGGAVVERLTADPATLAPPSGSLTVPPLSAKMTDFEYPACYFLPPFFFLQPVLDTQQKQKQMWSAFPLFQSMP